MSQGNWSITPYLIVDDAAKAIDFYIRAFGAREIARYPMANGKIGHAELELHGEKLFLADDPTENDRKRLGTASTKLRDTPVTIHVALPDVDMVFAAAIEAGAAVKWPVEDQFYGDRSGLLVDPFGYHWLLSTHLRDISHADLLELAKAAAT